MATTFSGMSRDIFLDKLVERTGKNGKELFEYLMGLIPEEKKEKNLREEPIKDFDSFYGSATDALSYLISLGADEFTQKLFKASSLEFRAAILAATARVRRFAWTAPMRILTPNMTEKEHQEGRTYIGFWDDNTMCYTSL